RQLTAEVDGVSIRQLLSNDSERDFDRPQQALFFHRPRRSFSAIRQGDYKLMLFWNNDGSINRRELFQVNLSPTEEGYDISGKNPEKAESLQNRLLAHLFMVDAERKKN
ncbi:MAG: sulfatase, partial [Verrucomicrobia bacterium]|nr:sulfatase [Verrucomicrobiota bacterium]